MQKPCPKCGKLLKNMPQKVQGAIGTDVRGSLTNPVLMRCAMCRKNFEFRGGKLHEVKDRP